jgi:hypothetical protein
MIRRKSKKGRGFGLLEIMMVITILALIVIIALPVYRDNTTKAQVSETMLFAGNLKTVIAEYEIINGSPPWSLTQLGHPITEGRYVNDAWFIEEDQTLVIQLGGNALGVNKTAQWKEVEFIYEITNIGNLRWNCYSDLEQRYLPPSCTSVAE